MPGINFIVSQPGVLPRSVRLEDERITLGRSSGCTLHIDDRFLSRTHAELVSRGGTWFLRDCGSANGTFVNDKQIDREVEIRLGDQIRIGDTEIRIDTEGFRDEVTLSGHEPDRIEQVPDLVLDQSQVQESAERTMIIHRLALELIGDRSMTELFEVIVDHVMSVMQPSRVAIALLRDDGESLEVVKFRAADASELTDLTISRTLLAQIIGERKVLAYTDIGSDELLAKAESIVIQGIHSALCAPLLVSDRVLGVLYMDYQMSRRLITEDDAQLAAQIARVAAIKLESTQLREAAMEKQRMDEALRLAQAIQMRMLPQEFPQRTDESLFELAASIRPARQVGGDFYDFYHASDDRLYLCIGDVSGKGIPAALLMAVTRALFRSKILQGESPGQMMTAVNRQLTQESNPEMFVTAFCAVLDLATGELRCSNGGHNPPILIGGSGEVKDLPTNPGIVLGFLENFDYGEQTFTISPGDALYFDTDGIAEATNDAGEMFSVERLKRLLEANAGLGVREILSRVVSAVEDFVLDAPQSDDLTLLVARYLRRAGSA